MELEAISGAATVALTSTIVFLLVAKAWNAVSRTVSRTPRFADRILHEAAQRFRDEFERLTSSQSIYLSGLLAFIMLFVATYVLNAKDLFAGYPTWQLYVQLAFLALSFGYVTFRLGRTIFARQRVRFLRDANIAIGHQLRQISTGFTRVFHDVQTSAGIVDHVIVGQNGLYAVNVVARRTTKNGKVRLVGHALEFSNAKESLPIVDVIAKTHRLEKEIREMLGHAARVRSVIAVPGWDISEQTSDEHLLVNECTIPVISGWKDNSDHLMNEDVEVVQQEMTARCLTA